MRILGLDHVNIVGSPTLIQRCIAFYVDVLGLTNGHRPDFSTRGFWLYAGEQPVIHLGERAADSTGTSSIDHFAFACDGLDETMARLREHGVEFTLDPAGGTKNAQLFLTDPAGVSLELNFV